ncbi:MAG: efflux RND transporter permease subunit, partial [Planctomycetia bacterium]|nr:efflux RND transporter permease subunit [Planctomycetia bacterium]
AQVASVVEGAQIRRGDASFFVNDPEEEGGFQGGPAVVLNVTKQPGADTRALTDAIHKAMEELRHSLPPDVQITSDLYQQKSFIDLSIRNVEEALRDGGILVAAVLFIFLMNFRTTLITLTAIPVSVLITAMVFHWSGLSINTMTLGGLAVAIGELVDDAIVDVENIFRRLRENAMRGNPEPAIRVVFDASCEIRNSIVFSTLIILVVFIPLFALQGMEGRLFVPLATAYMVSIGASLLVSLTLTPVLSHWLLSRFPTMRRNREGFVLRSLQWLAEHVIRFSLRFARPILVLATAGAILAGVALSRLERDFIPPFNEGVAQLTMLLPPGTSLARTTEVTDLVESRLQRVEGVRTILARTGRAEMDEHVIGANMTEFIITFDPTSPRSREEVLADLRIAVSAEEIPGIVTSVEQPMAHLISAMLSGVQSQIAIRIFGDDLERLRRSAEEIQTAIATVPGVTDLMVEQQSQIPQLRIQLNRDQLATMGLTPDEVNRFIETALNGRVVKRLFIGQRSCDLFVRLNSEYRDDPEAVSRLTLELPEGGRTTLGSVADIYSATGPNTINREQVRRRIVVQCNVTGRGLVDVVQDIQTKIEPLRTKLPTGYFITYGGQFESQRSASRTISVLFLLSLVGIFLILYTMFRSANLSLQVMAAIPMALTGSVAALYVTGQTFSVAAMVGFISLSGIATRNGILLTDHYLHLMRFEGESFREEMIIRAGKERLAPSLMTAITAGFGLIPLAMAAGEPGKEILYPIATVIIGGLISCTTLEFLVRPALFRTFSAGAVEKISGNDKTDLF